MPALNFQYKYFLLGKQLQKRQRFSKAPHLVMPPVLDHKSAAGSSFSLFPLAQPYSPAGLQVLGHQGCSGRLQLCSASEQTEAAPAFPSVPEHGVKCHSHPTAGRLRVPEDKLGKASVALGAGVSLPLSLCSKLKYTQSSFQPSELGPKPSPTSSP